MESMSVLLRTIDAFPRGRTTNELLALLNTDFDAGRRSEIYAELASLSASGKVFKGRDGKWRSATILHAQTAAEKTNSDAKAADISEARLLRAAPAQFKISVQTVAETSEEAAVAGPDPSALLRYYRSALRTAPRGGISIDGERQ